MPQKKNYDLQRKQNLLSKQGAQKQVEQELDSDLGEDVSAASSSKVTLDDQPPIEHTQTQLNHTIENLKDLALDPSLEHDIVLEDPPDDEEDPPDDRNPRSLADPEGDEASALPPIDSQESQDDSSPADATEKTNRKPIPHDEAKVMVSELNKIIESSFHGHGARRISTLGDVVLRRLRLMTGTLNLIIVKEMKLIEASQLAAVVCGRGDWAARQVRVWIRAYQKELKLPTYVNSTWGESVIEDEDLSAAILQWLRDRGKYVQARDIIDFFGTDTAAEFSCLIDAPPLLRTAQRWMYRMGYTWMKERRGQFADGHERDDVKDYRTNYYVPEWIKLERRMRSWDSEGNEIPPKLAEGERVVVVWFHDESTFYAHDRRLTRWVHETETAGIYKKGEGVSLMIADFVSADYGWLRLRPKSPSAAPTASSGTGTEQGSFNDAKVIFRAGKQRDGWFGTTNVVDQLSRAMSIVKEQYPNEDHIFVFDNATIHTKLPENAPNVNRMTLGPSQKVKGEEAGLLGDKIKIDYAPAILPDGTVQQLYYPMNHPIAKLQGAFKGMASILEERGVPNARKLKLVCAATDSNKQGCPPNSTNCCARRTMMNQPDILAQKSILQIQAAAEGFSIMYLPKYHCELNPIEQCWGAAKRVYRDSPSSSSEADLRQNMLRALDSVKLESIRRFAARSRRFVHAYGHGLSGSQAAWAAKKYRGHRVIPDTLLENLDDSY
ncbi:DDE superfamily endonuclease [Ceratobasidium sp. AG-Ba]|nr:DDE superfamily endonuclease [Ceratobasidium sp. AG-Ba]